VPRGLGRRRPRSSRVGAPNLHARRTLARAAHSKVNGLACTAPLPAGRRFILRTQLIQFGANSAPLKQTQKHTNAHRRRPAGYLTKVGLSLVHYRCQRASLSDLACRLCCCCRCYCSSVGVVVVADPNTMQSSWPSCRRAVSCWSRLSLRCARGICPCAAAHSSADAASVCLLTVGHFVVGVGRPAPRLEGSLCCGRHSTRAKVKAQKGAQHGPAAAGRDYVIVRRRIIKLRRSPAASDGLVGRRPRRFRSRPRGRPFMGPPDDSRQSIY
jgi:hypothetical protein